MWLYFNAKRRALGSSGYLTKEAMLADTKAPTIEHTEHSQRIEGIDGTWCYGRKVMLDAHSYEFDRFDLNGSAIFVHNE